MHDEHCEKELSGEKWTAEDEYEYRHGPQLQDNKEAG